MAEAPVKRCAIYTRKSSEEGLEQGYNSLDAQREACEAFIRSQAGEGWKLIKTPYDDGGFSGGTMERPALRRLLGDIGEGLIDVVVVYKVDRLTRSLADFARMVELFEARKVSFVAVTQQFNTTSSMGRLTLNVLLSFAQFEREVAGERIRDKVAASRRKGMWMGGTVPMGYELGGKKLVVNRAEAGVVQQLFERYLELGSVRALKQDLDARGVVSGIKVSEKGNSRGGKPFSGGALYHMLSNPLYVGEVRHRGARYPGQHEAIISRELWERVQERLKRRAPRMGGGRKDGAGQSFLAGKLFDEAGEPLYVQGAARGRRRYRYYVSKRLVVGGAGERGDGWRLSAGEIERAVCAAAGLPALLASARGWSERLESRSGMAAGVLAELIERVVIGCGGMRISLRLPIAAGGEGSQPSHLALARLVPMEMRRRGVELRLVLAGDDTPGRVDLPLLKAVARARRWGQELVAGRVESVAELARREKLDRRSVRRLLQLGFLSPRIVEAIAAGRQPPDLSVIRLTRRTALLLLWSAQEQALGID